jgi:hypothetical protein
MLVGCGKPPSAQVPDSIIEVTLPDFPSTLVCGEVFRGVLRVENKCATNVTLTQATVDCLCNLSDAQLPSLSLEPGARLSTPITIVGGVGDGKWAWSAEVEEGGRRHKLLEERLIRFDNPFDLEWSVSGAESVTSYSATVVVGGSNPLSVLKLSMQSSPPVVMMEQGWMSATDFVIDLRLAWGDVDTWILKGLPQMALLAGNRGVIVGNVFGFGQEEELVVIEFDERGPLGERIVTESFALPTELKKVHELAIIGAGEIHVMHWSLDESSRRLRVALSDSEAFSGDSESLLLIKGESLDGQVLVTGKCLQVTQGFKNG